MDPITGSQKGERGKEKESEKKETKLHINSQSSPFFSFLSGANNEKLSSKIATWLNYILLFMASEFSSKCEG